MCTHAPLLTHNALLLCRQMPDCLTRTPTTRSIGQLIGQCREKDPRLRPSVRVLRSSLQELRPHLAVECFPESHPAAGCLRHGLGSHDATHSEQAAQLGLTPWQYAMWRKQSGMLPRYVQAEIMNTPEHERSQFLRQSHEHILQVLDSNSIPREPPAAMLAERDSNSGGGDGGGGGGMRSSAAAAPPTHSSAGTQTMSKDFSEAQKQTAQQVKQGKRKPRRCVRPWYY